MWLLCFGGAARADPLPPGWTAEGLAPIGYSDLGGLRGGFKMALHRSGDRWRLYMGHRWRSGWTIVDVTHPATPRHVGFVPGPAYARTTQVWLRGDLMVATVDRSFEAKDVPAAEAPSPGLMFYSLKNPDRPALLSTWRTGGQGTRNLTFRGDHLYVSAGMLGHRGPILIVLDISDPAVPKEVGRFAAPGSGVESPEPAAPVGYFGPLQFDPDGATAVAPYSPDMINLDMTDPVRPRLAGKLTLVPPFAARSFPAVHTALPVGDGLVYVSGEPLTENCADGLDLNALVDNRNPATPRLIAVLPTPRPAVGAWYRNFCDRPGRFGPRNAAATPASAGGGQLYVSFFNAGLRRFDLTDPRLPRETGWFLPPDPEVQLGGGTPVAQAADVLVDPRGHVYLTDEQWGLFVLRPLAMPARSTAP